MNKLFRFVFFGSIAFIIALSAFFMLSNKAKAANTGEFVRFRIDTELNVLNAKGATVEWSCNGTASGSITDNTASESAADLGVVADGIIDVASASKEMTDPGCTVLGSQWDGSKTISAKVSIDGWVTRRWTATLVASASVPFTTGASQDYNLVVYPVNQELDSALTLSGTSSTASASYGTSASIASSSYSNALGSVYKKYIAAIADATLTAGNDGYQNRTKAITWSGVYGTASKSVAFDGGTDAGNALHGSTLPFAYKFYVSPYTSAIITGGAITAGSNRSCSESGATAYYYCAVPLGDTETTATFTKSGYTSTNYTYALRTTGGSSQVTGTIYPALAGTGGTDYSGGYVWSAPSSTPTPTPTPVNSVAPTPTLTPVPTPTPHYTPVNQPQGSVILYRKAGNSKVYVQNSNGVVTWVPTLESFNAAGYKWSDVKVISSTEFAGLNTQSVLKTRNGVTWVNIRDKGSLAGKVIGKFTPSNQYTKQGYSNGWYKIDLNGKIGWVSAGYVSEN